MARWEYLEVVVEGIHWRDSLGRQGQLPWLVSEPSEPDQPRPSRWARPAGPAPLSAASTLAAAAAQRRRWESLAPLLNELGEQGWQLAAVMATALEHRLSSAEYRLLLTRQRDE